MPQQKTVYTVTQINSMIKGVLEGNLPPRLTVVGEITDFRPHHSGHCYFSLKDDSSNLPCAMWKSNAGLIKFEIENGLEAMASGFIDVYVPHGRYQLIVEKLIPAGKGDLQLAFEQMVKKLQVQGLFDEAHKKPLPAYPMSIGILTSETGAAVQDIKKSIHDRWPCAKLFLYPVPVQGKQAAQEIAAAIRDVNSRNDKLQLELLIVGRGGGSIEDLWAFNEEVLARAIYDSEIPIIIAVGHEYDTTIADMVADARASTPTKAGVVAVPDKEEVLSGLSHIQKRLAVNAHGRLELYKKALAAILASAVFRNPMLAVRNREQQLDELTHSLSDAAGDLLSEIKNKLAAAGEKIARLEPHRLIGKKTVEIGELQNRVSAVVKLLMHKQYLHLAAAEGRLTALNPRSVLGRGYSITTNAATGKVIMQLEDVRIGDIMTTELADGSVESRVTKTKGLVD